MSEIRLPKYHDKLVAVISDLHRARRRVLAEAEPRLDEAVDEIMSVIRSLQFVIGDMLRDSVGFSCETCGADWTWGVPMDGQWICPDCWDMLKEEE